MTRIPSDLARFGLRVELVPGWETRGSASFAPACVVDHWTAGPRGAVGRPSLKVVVDGRPGLEGPLANVYLDRGGVCVVVAAGRASHAGAGGFRGLVGNSAAYGIEAECGGDGDWTPEQLWAYPRLDAALLWGLGRDASWLLGHHMWAPTRKIDIRDIFGQVQSDTESALANSSGGFLMALNDAQQADIYNRIAAINDTLGSLNNYLRFGGSGDQVLRDTYNAAVQARDLAAIAAATGDVDATKLAQLLAPLLTAQLSRLSPKALAQVATAVADEQDRRARDGDPATGPVS